MNAHAKLIWKCDCGHVNNVILIPFSDDRGGSSAFLSCQNYENCRRMFKAGYFVERYQSKLTDEFVEQLDQGNPPRPGEKED